MNNNTNKTNRQILREHFQTLDTKLSFTEWMAKLKPAEEKRIVDAAKPQDTSGDNVEKAEGLVEKAEDLVEKAEQLVESADRTLHEAAQHPQGASEEHPQGESSGDNESDKLEQLSPEQITGQHNRRKTDGNGDDQHQGGQEEGHQGEHQEQVDEIDEELEEMEQRFGEINDKLKDKDPDVAEAIGMMLEEVKGLHQRVKAIGEGGHVSLQDVEEGKASKAKLAREIFESELEKKGKKGMVRKDIINQFLKIGLTPSGANTYYQNFRSEHGLVERR